jgi:hypothetical protein
MTRQIICPICAQPTNQTKRLPDRGITIFDCPVCGEYGLTGFASIELEGMPKEDKAKLSVYFRERYLRQEPTITLSIETHPAGTIDIPVVGIDDILKVGFPPSISERLDRGLQNIRRLSSHLGASITLDVAKDYPVLFATNEDEFCFILATLKAAGFIDVTGAHPLSNISLTFAGWNRIAELERVTPTKDSKQAFVAMWFDGSLDKAYSAGIANAVRSAGYEPLRVDLKEHNEKICDTIIAEIRKSRFLVADITGTRSGVFFEAGYALGMGLKVIWTCKESHKDELDKHFDTRQYNHIIWTDEHDLHEKLRRRIQATITDS